MKESPLMDLLGHLDVSFGAKCYCSHLLIEVSGSQETHLCRAGVWSGLGREVRPGVVGPQLRFPGRHCLGIQERGRGALGVWCI